MLARVETGERPVVTRDGIEVAELRPLPRRLLSTEQLIAGRRSLPPLDLAALRADLDAIIDPAL